MRRTDWLVTNQAVKEWNPPRVAYAHVTPIDYRPSSRSTTEIMLRPYFNGLTMIRDTWFPSRPTVTLISLFVYKIIATGFDVPANAGVQGVHRRRR